MAATAEVLDEAGWLHTGDVGYYDEEGWWYVVDRIKAMIKVNGKQVKTQSNKALYMSDCRCHQQRSNCC